MHKIWKFITRPLFRLKRIVIFAVGYFKNKKCKWHEGDCGYDSHDECGCPNCGIMIETIECKGCGKYFVDWMYDGDDLIAGGRVDSHGDFCCDNCISGIERRYEEMEDEDGDYYWEAGYGHVDTYNLPDDEREGLGQI